MEFQEQASVRRSRRQSSQTGTSRDEEGVSRTRLGLEPPLVPLTGATRSGRCHELLALFGNFLRGYGDCGIDSVDVDFRQR